MLNTAIVGLRWWGKELVRSARGSKLMRFTQGVTLEPETARDFAKEMNISIGTCYENVLADRSIDAVVLATPHSAHRAQVEAAAAAGKHVFCEKPFALNVEDAKAAIAACRKAGVALGVGQNRRLWPSIAKLKDVISSAEFGTIMFAEGNYSHDILANTPLDNWRSAPQETKAGGMTGMGIHVLDCFRSLVGPMKRIAALSKARALKLDTGDTTSALIEFDSGATGTLATTIKTPFEWRIAVYGENCHAMSVSETRAIVKYAGKDAEVIDKPAESHLGRNLDYFAKAALGQGAFPISPDGILQTASALEAVFKSVDADGTWMTV